MKLSVEEASREAAATVALIAGPQRLTWLDVARRVHLETAPLRAQLVLRPSIDLTSALAIYAAIERNTALVLRHPKRVEAPALPDSLAPGSVSIESSGTSGQPKLVVHSREAMISHAEASAAVLGSFDDDRWLVCLPLAHVSGLAPLIRALVGRRGVILESRFDPSKIARSIEVNNATHLSLIPTMLEGMMGLTWRPPQHLRHVLVGGARCPQPLLERARDRGYPVVLAYGMSETFSHVALDGRPLPGVEFRIDDDVLSVRSPTSVSYPHWLVTGDLATAGDDGRINILGRADEMIITGGENVSPAAVENALLALPEIRAAAVVAVPDTRWGEVVGAVVVPETPSLAAEQTRAWDRISAGLRDKLASFERPRRYVELHELPRLANGKLDRRALIKLFE